MATLVFLRPAWLMALLALPLLAWWLRRGARAAEGWRRAVDAHLLPHLLDERSGPRRRIGPWLAAAAYGLAVLALAGPSWRTVQQPLWQSRVPVVIAV